MAGMAHCSCYCYYNSKFCFTVSFAAQVATVPTTRLPVAVHKKRALVGSHEKVAQQYIGVYSHIRNISVYNIHADSFPGSAPAYFASNKSREGPGNEGNVLVF